jgi:pimeloyl-ACP methyl ester carboxylesterase
VAVFAILLMGILVTALGIAFGGDEELVGSWEFVITADGEQLPGFLIVERDGEKLTGSLKTYNAVLDLRDVTWSGDLLGFELTVPQWRPDPVRVEMRRHGRIMEGRATDGIATHRAWAMKELALEKPALPYAEEGEINGARYAIEIPEGWNGGLVMYVHGYVPHGAPQRLRGTPVTTGDKTLDQYRTLGYATARSAYSLDGFALREGSLETEALRQYFWQRFGRTWPTLLAGTHQGGVITQIMIERYPEVYDGALVWNGATGPTLASYKLIFDFRLMFDFYFPGLPGSAVDVEDVDTLYRRTLELVAPHPERLERFLAMTGLRSAEEVALAVTNYSSNLHDIHRLAGGNPFDNTNTVYSGSDDDATLNRGIPRYTADPGAEDYLRAWYTPTGRISDPVLSVHALRDSLVPIETRQWFDDATRIQDTNHLFVQMWVDQDWARYDRSVVDRAVGMLDRWVREGVRPEPGELTVQ